MELYQSDPLLIGHHDAKAVIEIKQAVIVRFGDLVLRPLIKLYNIPSTSVHIFYDRAGPLIAFNRNGSLFLNLRYYEAWHDNVCNLGSMNSWLLTRSTVGCTEWRFDSGIHILVSVTAGHLYYAR